MDKGSQRPVLFKIAKGATVGKVIANDNELRGDADFIVNEGEIESASLKRNRHIIPTRLKPVVDAIKKQSADDSKGWKIMIIGALLSIPVGIFLVHYSGWLEERTQKETSIPQSKQSQ